MVVELLLTALLGIFTATHLGVNMDNKQLLSPDLPFQRAAREYAKHFPSLDDSLLVVIDAETPERAREAANQLAQALRDQPDDFRDAYIPGNSTFFQRYGLLYLSPDAIDEFVDRIAVMQPMLAELSVDPSTANLARLIRIGLEQAEESTGTSPADWSIILDKVGEATVRTFEEYPVSVSWERMMLEGTALEAGTRQIVVAEPVLEFGRLLAAQSAIQAIRSAGHSLGLNAEQGVRLRITGNPALNYEEMFGLAWDIGISTLLSLVVVVALLYAALLSMRLVGAAAITLVVGLVWTAAFAALAVGHLNVLSIAFAVLFIGLGVDFAIHLGMQFAHALHEGAGPTESMQISLQRTSTALVLCAFTTALGFLAFYPTGYRGVAELGLISAAGMFITLFQTMTLFPALISLMRAGETPPKRESLPFQLTPPSIVATHPKSIAFAALLVGVSAASVLPLLRFDMNVVEMRDPRTESVQAFRDLLEDSRTSPWYIDAIADSLPEATRLAERMRELPEVRSAAAFTDYVPTDQAIKRDSLETVAMMLELPPSDPKPPPSIAEQISALRQLHTALQSDSLLDAEPPLGDSARQLSRHLEVLMERLEGSDDPAAALADLQRVLLGNFADELARLQTAVDPPPLTLDDLPDDLRSRMLASDGSARVQIFPRDELRTSEEVALFVDSVRAVDPDATGVAVNLLEFGRETSKSLRQALAMAFTAIALLLLLLWRRPVDAALVLAPLALGAAITGALMVALDIPFNFANVIVLPLLIGIGVDSGIHLVHAERHAAQSDQPLDSVATRAVFFSSLTTIASFGSLSLSAHRGIASLGVLLVSGILIVLACNLVVLPALLQLRRRARA